MLGRLSDCMAAFCLLLAGAGLCPAQTASPPVSPKSPTAQESPRALSPLHAFLGIDPVTGEFKAPSAPPKVAQPAPTPATSTAQSRPSTADGLSDPASGEPSTANAPLRDVLSRAVESGELPPGNTVVGDTTIDDLRAQITKAVDEKDEQGLMAALTKATGGAASDELFPFARYAQWATLARLVYPLGIALGALYFAWAGRRRNVRTDRDRRHDARQLRRRLTLAACSAGTIGLCWLAGENGFWWSEPRKLLAALVATTVLLLVSAGLRMLIRRATSDYSRKTIEDLRCQHAALCDEVKELRKRLQGEGIPETV
jgi:hypothetical protein